MAESPQPPVLTTPVPLIAAQENVILEPIDLIDYIQADEDSADLIFTATTDSGDVLPQGLFCTADGFITGIAEPGTAGNYTIVVNVKGQAEQPLIINVSLTIAAQPQPVADVDVTLANPPFLAAPIPPLHTHVGAAFGPIDLWEYVKADDNSGDLTFVAGLANGNGLPQGVICTRDGFLTGIPAKDTEGTHNVVLEVKSLAPEVLKVECTLTINARPEVGEVTPLGEIKAQIWDAVGHNLPLPDLADIVNRPVTSAEVYYLLQRFAVLTIWDIYNLEPAGEKTLLTLKGASEHYNVYDRGSCLVAAPKDLFSHERTLEDALKTARAMAGEVYKRGWTIEFSGFNKMARAAWVEVQILGDKHGKPLEVLHYDATSEDIRVYAAQAQSRAQDLPSPP
ncbi:MAG: hypothetical protein P4M12_05655 [Gammaproteobacteria bacterium]|nr:hypothetical protein [Gammaproteobacteria bacterium]